ncbi:MAG: hypothetical protein LBL49_08790 [Clostridiales Family XIII bacterium]|nr:hypothetical protein [Clostridiales Family XIII bacterium]
MRKFSSIISIVLLTLILSTGVCSAASLNLLRNYPEDGSTSSYPINLGIKLFFDGDISSTESLREANQSCFSLTGADGKEVPILVLFPDDNNKYILVVAEPPDKNVGLGSNLEYTLTIGEELEAKNGAVLGEAQTISFTTRDSGADMKINMAMMAVMFVGMIGFSSFTMRRQAKKANETDDKAKVNPYKVAKETGKSVTEIVEKEEKRKKKAASSKPGGAGGKPVGAASAEKDEDKYADKRVKRVGRPHPISEGGGVYRSGRKAAAEKRAREEAERRAKGTTRPKKSTGKKKKK